MAIRFTDYITELASLQPGETKRVNHKDCTAGTDTKQRLYLTKPTAQPNKVLGYCHNCQVGGTAMATAHKTFRATALVGETDIPVFKSYRKPTSLTYDPAEWSAAAQRWRIMSKLTPDLITDFGIAWNHDNNTIYMPIWDKLEFLDSELVSHGKFLGHQERHLNPASSCKYTTHKADKDVLLGTVILCKTRLFSYNKKNVLVEDLVSGINIKRALAKVQQGAVFVNYGTQVKPTLLATAGVNGTNKVWLDNDTEHVIEQATKIADVWKMISNRQSTVISGYSDPKYYTGPEIKDVIKSG